MAQITMIHPDRGPIILMQQDDLNANKIAAAPRGRASICKSGEYESLIGIACVDRSAS